MTSEFGRIINFMRGVDTNKHPVSYLFADEAFFWWRWSCKSTWAFSLYSLQVIFIGLRDMANSGIGVYNNYYTHILPLLHQHRAKAGL